jgi:hypothetical protein
MNPLIQLKKATPLFVIALVLACFTLSPQAFAGTVVTPTFTPYYSACHRYELRVSTPTSGATISVWGVGTAGMRCVTSCTIPLTKTTGGTLLFAQASKIGWITSGRAQTYYRIPDACH